MGEPPDFDDLVDEPDPEGEIETRMFQEQGRVDIPDEYADFHGIEEGDNVLVICDEGSILIKRADKDTLTEGL